MTWLVFILRTADTLTSHLLVVRIYASFHPKPQLLAQKRDRPRCHGNSISPRGDHELQIPSSRRRTETSRTGRKVRKARKESRYRPWSSRGEATTSSREGGTSRDRVIHRRYTPFRILPRDLDFLCLSASSFFSFFLSLLLRFSSFFRIWARRFASYVQARNFR